MANPTTNYGFVLPTSTDLVTDLPADFDVALQGVDTRLKALQPGTTLGDLAYSSATANTNTRLGIGSNGQVLAVVAGVPAWAATSDQTPLTTKGDLFTFTTVDARIGVGANNTVLTADSAEATGLKWAAATADSMTLISTTALTGASVTLSSIPQTYKQLVLFIRGHYPSTNNALFRMRVNGSSSSVYDGAGEQSNATLEYIDQNHVKLGVYGQASSGTNFTTNHVTMTIPDYTTSSVFKVLNFLQIWRTGEATPRAIFESIAWAFKDTTAITSLEFTYSTGNIGGGTVELYGVK